MAAPVNPKKKSLMASGPLRRKLRAAGHHLASVVQVGKEGVSAPVVRQLEQALRDHELVKVKVGSESPQDRFEVAERLAADSGAHVAQILGRTVLVYKKHPEKPRFEPGPPSAAREPALARRARPRPARRTSSSPRR